MWKLLALLLVGCAPLRPVALAMQPLPRVRDADWPMFRDDVERSGFAEGSHVGDFIDRVWEIPAFNTTEYSAAKGSPSIVGDVLYCGTDSGKFVAAHTSDGSIVWQVQLGGTSHGIHGSPAIVGDTVYIGAYDGSLYAFERQTGLLRWRHRQGYQVGSSPAVVPEWAMVYSSHEEALGTGDVIALDARTGLERWRRATLAHPHSSVAVDVQRGLVFVGDNLGVVYAFDAHSGHERWRRELDRDGNKADVKTTPTVIPELGLLVFGAWSGVVYALDVDSGSVRWTHRMGGKLMGSSAYLPATQTIFVGSPRGVMHALSARSGDERWATRIGASIYSSPAVSGDGSAVVFGAADGKLYALRTDTGEPLWSTWLGGQLSGSPSLVGARIYMTGKKGSLWALETRDQLATAK